MVDNRKIRSYNFSRQELEVDNRMPASFTEDYLSLWLLVREMNDQLNGHERRITELEAGSGPGPEPEPRFREILLAHNPIIYYGFDQAAFPLGGDVENLGSGPDGTIIANLDPGVGIPAVINDGLRPAGAVVRNDMDLTLPSGKTVGFFSRQPPDSSSPNSYLFSMSNQFDVILNFGGTNVLSVFRGGSDSPIGATEITADFPKDNTWYFWTVTHSGGIVSLYRNGEIQDSLNVGSFTASFTSSAFCGIPQGGNRYFGDMDEAFLIDRALTSSEVLELYENSGLV